MDIQEIKAKDINKVRTIFQETPRNTLAPWQRTRRPTKTAVIAALASEIIEMRRKGYSTQEVATIINDNLFSLNADTLRAIMRSIGVSLFVPVSEVRAVGLGKPGDTAAQSEFANALHDTKDLLAMDVPAVPGFVDVPRISQAARARLSKMSASDVTLFRQAVSALHPGSQTIEVSPDVEDIASNLVQAGLLRRRQALGKYVFEIPKDFACVNRVLRQAQPLA